MNLFILSKDPKEAAQLHVDKHVVKMILEACQMLYSAHYMVEYPELQEIKSAVAVSKAQKLLDIPKSLLHAPAQKNGSIGYRPVHLHHPCTKWIAASLQNYEWAVDLAVELGNEYHYRYGKEHSCMEHALFLMENPPKLPELGLQPFAIAMLPQYIISDDPLECYYHYYRTQKAEKGIIQYTKREIPDFLKIPI